MKVEYLAIDKWDDTYNEGGIYALVDQDGKRYIGRAKHIQNRLHQHRVALNSIIRTGKCCATEGNELVEAVKNGKRFKAEILKKICFSESTENNFRYWENYYVQKYGGYPALYNTAFIYPVNPFCKRYDDLEIALRFYDPDIIEWLDRQERVNSYIKQLIRDDMKKKCYTDVTQEPGKA